MNHTTPNERRTRSGSLNAGKVMSNLRREGRSKESGQPQPHFIQEGEGNSGSGERGGLLDRSSPYSDSDMEMSEVHSDEDSEDDEEAGLTRYERHKRRKRKQGNTHSNGTIVPEADVTKAEKKLASQMLLRTSLINVLLIGLWYIFSISISVYNKWMFSKGKDKLDFHFPLFTTCVHMVVQFVLASAVLLVLPEFRPGHASTREQPDSSKPLMTRLFYLTRIGPCGAATGLDIGLGNMSLKLISLTFYTMCKSSVLGFVLLFAFVFRLEKPSWSLGAIIATMTAGVIMMVAGETAFDVLGFALVMSAALSSGFRWSLTQILLLRHPATSNPFSSIFFLAPVMLVSLLILAIPVEGVAELNEGVRILTDAKGVLLGALILLFPGMLAFLMTASEFALLKRTSVVTLSIAGIFKEVVTISAAGLVFGDQLTPINISGLVVTIGSIGAYNYMKLMKMRSEARADAHLASEEYAPVLSTEDETYHANEETANGEESTRRLIRNSLSINPGLHASPPAVESPLRAVPVKRPENFD